MTEVKSRKSEASAAYKKFTIDDVVRTIFDKGGSADVWEIAEDLNSRLNIKNKIAGEDILEKLQEFWLDGKWYSIEHFGQIVSGFRIKIDTNHPFVKSSLAEPMSTQKQVRRKV